MKKKGGGGDEGGSWMDTYGDLVTLLLCFFVLLYSMSSIDSNKWDLFVKSIFPNGRPGEKSAEQVVLNGEITNNIDAEEEDLGSMGQPEIQMNELEDMDQLYIMLANSLNEAGVEDVEVSQGEDYTFVVFQDKAFFTGDSSALTQQGQDTLEVFCNALRPFNDRISQVNIMGHTAQADPTRPNNPRNDRMLSVMRAAEVCVFIQTREVFNPEKLICIGYGQYRPVASNETPEGRSQNRRVEILLIDEGAEVKDLNHYFDEFNSGANADTTIVTSGNASENISDGAAAPPASDVGDASLAAAAADAEMIEAGQVAANAALAANAIQ